VRLVRQQEADVGWANGEQADDIIHTEWENDCLERKVDLAGDCVEQNVVVGQRIRGCLSEIIAVLCSSDEGRG
jgi:hypothetical protein